MGEMWVTLERGEGTKGERILLFEVGGWVGGWVDGWVGGWVGGRTYLDDFAEL